MLAAVEKTPVLRGVGVTQVGAGDWEELTACPVCTRVEDLHDAARVYAGERVGTVLEACAECAHLFLRRRPNRAWFDAYYASEWDARGRDSTARKPRAAHKVAEFCAPYLPEGARVLDVGAGFGDQLLGFRERGYEPFGLERCEHRARAVGALGIPCAFGPFERAELPPDLDLVFSHHVLEHVDDVASVIAAQAAQLRTHGLVYVAVPDLWAEHPPQTVHFVPHLSAFSERSLERLLRRHGLEPIARKADRELQFLARKADVEVVDLAAATESERAAFLERVARWLWEGFDGAPGRHLLVWFKSRDSSRVYETSVRRPSLAPARRALDAAEHRLRGAGRGLRARLDPAATSRTARSVVVAIGGDAELPAIVRHPAEAPPVWIR